MQENTRKLYAKAVEETCLSYYRKYDRIQYESSHLTYLHPYLGGPQRRTDGFSPEEATRDSYRFSVCSSFFYNFLLDVCGHELCGSALHHTCVDVLKNYKDQIIYEYHEGQGTEMAKGADECLAALEEGDALITHARNGTYHIMQCISGDRLIHCAGGKMNFKTGVETWENSGAIRVDKISDFMLDCRRFGFNIHSEWWVVRLLDAIDPEKYPLTPQATYRLEHPGLVVERTANLRAYQAAQPGDVITYTVSLRNDNFRGSKIALNNLEVVETIPAGTTLVESSLDGEVQVEGNTLMWNVSLRSVQARIVQYSVRVNDDVEPGTYIVSDNCRVGDIPNRTIRTLVSHPRLSLADCAKLRALADEEALKAAKVSGDGVAQWVYESVLGKKTAIPTAQEVLDGLYERTAVECIDDEDRETYKNNVILKEKGSAPQFASMMVPHLLGGQTLGHTWWTERVLELRTEHLFPGDVIVCVKELTKTSFEAEQMVILGGGKAILSSKDGIKVIDICYMDVMMISDYFTVLRPYLGGFAE